VLGSGDTSMVTPDFVRSLYPGLDDPQVIAAVLRDVAGGW